MKRKQKARVTVEKKEKGKGYNINVGGRKRTGALTKRTAEIKAKRIRDKRAK